MKIIYLLLFLFISFLCLVLMHIIITRFSVKLKKVRFSNQKLLFFIIILFNLPVLVLFCIIFKEEINKYSFIYFILVFNSLSYIYFHFFNMSETARRIKILIMINKKQIKKIDDLEKFYNYNEALDIRLKRLVDLGQIKAKPDNTYVLKIRLLLLVANLIIFFRILLGFHRIER